MSQILPRIIVSSGRGAHSIDREDIPGHDARRLFPERYSRGAHSADHDRKYIPHGVIAAVLAIVIISGALPFVIGALVPGTAIAKIPLTTSFVNEVLSPTAPEPTSLIAQKLDVDDLYLTQSESGRCTVCAAAMMLRRKAYLDGDDGWGDITETSVAQSGWVTGGLLDTFTASGMKVRQASLSSSGSQRVAELRALLDEHPEGIVIYDADLPHAILLVDYNADNGVFYCADPADGYSGKRIAMSNTWNGANRGDQDSVIAALDSYWYIA